ncbi:hypothetical protein [Lysinibacillus sp. NPDC086135]|uniref:hypothetical protein n=1 Tax=Lysinibacillus sp. NPDC086135 TaxID=3364130 RepID=UPI0038065D52
MDKSNIKDYLINLLDSVEDDFTEEIIRNIVSNVIREFNTKCDYFHAGNYDDGGYACDYFNIVWIDANGELDAVDVQANPH